MITVEQIEVKAGGGGCLVNNPRGKGKLKSIGYQLFQT